MNDKTLIKSRFSANFSTYNDNASVQKKTVEELTKLIPYINYGNILEIGAGTGLLTKKLDYLNAQKLFINDLCENITLNIKPQNLPYEFIIGDAEEIEFPHNLDLIVSANAIQWFDNLKTFFQKSAQALNPKGKLIFSTFITDNYKEITQTFGISLNYKTSDEILDCAKNFFDIKSSKQETITIYFETLKDLLSHIKATGANAVSTTNLTKTKFVEAKNLYEQLRNKNGLPLTYHPAYFVLEKP